MAPGPRLACLAVLAAALAPARAAEPVDFGTHVVSVVRDLDGDGVRDVADLTGALTADAVLTARSGATGAVLWRLAHPFLHEVRPLRDGVLASTWVRNASAGALWVGRDGVPRWERVWPSRGALLHVGAFLAGTGDDVVARVAPVVAGPGLTEVLDGGTGVTVAVIPQAGLDATPAGDLDGDGLVDLYWRRMKSVHAATGDGRLLWTTTVDNAGVVPLGDVTGDGRADLATTGSVSLLSGADGRELWSGAGAIPYALGPGLVGTVTELVQPATLRAYDARGRLRYARTVPFHNATPAGDLTGDGVRDLHATWEGQGRGEESRIQEGFVDGRTGRVFRTNPTRGEYPLGATVDCRGADTWRQSGGRRGVLVRVRDGRTDRVVWSLTVPVADQDTVGRSVVVVPFPRPAGTCGSSALVVGADYLAVAEATGRVRWAVGAGA